MLAWLSVWSEVQTCIWPSWCHCRSLSLASVKSRLVPLCYVMGYVSDLTALVVMVHRVGIRVCDIWYTGRQRAPAGRLLPAVNGSKQADHGRRPLFGNYQHSTLAARINVEKCQQISTINATSCATFFLKLTLRRFNRFHWFCAVCTNWKQYTL